MPAATVELRQLALHIRSVGTPAWRRDLSAVLGAEALAILDDEFTSSTNPYGVKWDPLTSRTGLPLSDTGTHLLNKFSWGIAPSGFYVRNNFVGVPVHQYGAIIKPVHAKALRFRTRKAATKSNPRGKFNPFQFRQSVRIPRRQMMPEADTGGLGQWGPRFNTAADGFMQRTMGW